MMKTLSKVFIVFLFLFWAFSVYSKPIKTIGPECHYEITREIDNGVVVKETRVEKCREKVVQGDKEFDPEKNPADKIKRDATYLLMYATFVALVNKL